MCELETLCVLFGSLACFFVAANAHHIAHSNVSSYVDLFRIAHMPRERKRSKGKQGKKKSLNNNPAIRAINFGMIWITYDHDIYRVYIGLNACIVIQ